MRPVTRVNPAMPAHAYKTYQIVSPVNTHFRPGTCEEVECPNYTKGWKTVIDEGMDLGKGQAYYIRKQSGRKFKEQKLPDGRTEFEFEAGQVCFGAADHRVRLERPEIYLVRDGDWRGNPRRTTPRKHVNAGEWQEDFAEHQDKIKTEIDKG